jgi:hypothetical protein
VFVALNLSNPNFGCTTCVDLPPFLNSTSFGKLFGPLCVVANGILENTSIAELDRRLRADFNSKMKSRAYLNALKASLDGFPSPQTRAAAVDVSNVGVFNLPHPITDLWVQQTMKSRAIEGEFGILTSAVTARGTTKIMVRFQSSPTVVNARDASRAFKAIVHCLKYIPSNATVGDAIREIRAAVLG